MEQTEIKGAERTEIGQVAYDVIEQKQHVADEQEKLGEMLQTLLGKMREQRMSHLKASGFLFTIQDVGEKLKITKG